MRSRVLEAESGICQHCGLHAHDLFLKVRDAPPSHRKDMLDNTWLAQLSLKQVRKHSQRSNLHEENDNHSFFNKAGNKL